MPSLCQAEALGEGACAEGARSSSRKGGDPEMRMTERKRWEREAGSGRFKVNTTAKQLKKCVAERSGIAQPEPWGPKKAACKREKSQGSASDC